MNQHPADVARLELYGPKTREYTLATITDEDFSDIRTLTVGERVPDRGTSSFKVIPGYPNECVGLKSVEIGDHTETWLFRFDLDGNVLQEDTLIGRYKCEGVEIL